VPAGARRIRASPQADQRLRCTVQRCSIHVLRVASSGRFVTFGRGVRKRRPARSSALRPVLPFIPPRAIWRFPVRVDFRRNRRNGKRCCMSSRCGHHQTNCRWNFTRSFTFCDQRSQCLGAFPLPFKRASAGRDTSARARQPLVRIDTWELSKERLHRCLRGSEAALTET
jgi:hypothetical protein